MKPTSTSSAIALCLTLVAMAPATARAAPGSKASQGDAAQASRLQEARRSFDKLTKDRKRIRFRDAWLGVIRDFELAVRLAPAGPRAAEARLEAARARERLWSVSRAGADGKAAIEAYRKVDEKSPGSPLAAKALTAAAALAKRLNRDVERVSICKRIGARYASASPPPPACAGMPLARDAAPAKASAPVAGKPVDPDADDDAAEPRASAPASAPAAAAPAAQAATAGHAAVDARDSKALAALVQKGEPDVDDDESAPDAEEAEALHEPEVPAPANAVAAAAPAAAADDDDEDERPEAADTARALRKAALADGAMPLAAQLGLKVRRVAIDAGHGGKDTGAIGKKGVREKDVSLAIAKRLEKKLRAMGLDVVQTRKGDETVGLDERARIANEAKADLFVSIHCNAARRRNVSGVETWTLNVASNRYSARLAAFENAGSSLRQSDLRLILADLAKKADTSEARDLAHSVQGQLIRTVRTRVGPVRDHGVKQALFYVLLGTRMPSILVETAFLSNATEEARLKSGKYQEVVADGIARGLKDWLDGRQRIAKVGVP